MGRWMTKQFYLKFKICIKAYLLIYLLPLKLWTGFRRGGRVVEGARLESVYPASAGSRVRIPLSPQVLEIVLYLRTL